MNCYAAWNPSCEDRRGSASGGIASMLASQIIKEGGVYFGTRWGEDMRACVAWTEKDVRPFRGSRYVQSLFSPEVRETLETFLKAGRTVFFVGTPCQVASLRKLKERYPEQLLCADLLCHGTTGASWLADEVRYLAKGQPVSDIRFREGPVFRMSLWNGERCISSVPAERSPYLYAYLSGISLRPACYTGPFANLKRTGDLTLGDFIGLPGNVSFVWPHTEAGDRLLHACGAVLEEHPLQERLAYRPGILEPTHAPTLEKRFRQAIARETFPKAIRSVLRGYFIGLPFRKAWKWLHHQAHLVKSSF